MLELEITESAVMQRVEDAIHVLGRAPRDGGEDRYLREHHMCSLTGLRNK